LNPHAIQHARARLEWAEEAVEALAQAETFGGLVKAWMAFVTNFVDFFQKLDFGAEGDPASETWKAKSVGLRRTDPLLAYIRQARNSERYGLNGSVQQAYRLEPIPEGTVRDLFAEVQPNGDMRFWDVTALTGASAALTGRPNTDLCEEVFLPLTGALSEVVDGRSGKTFPPPAHHMGKPVDSPTALRVAQAGLAWMKASLDEVEALTSP
jgi:hypothetical protein